MPLLHLIFLTRVNILLENQIHDMNKSNNNNNNNSRFIVEILSSKKSKQFLKIRFTIPKTV